TSRGLPPAGRQSGVIPWVIPGGFFGGIPWVFRDFPWGIPGFFWWIFRGFFPGFFPAASTSSFPSPAPPPQNRRRRTAPARGPFAVCPHHRPVRNETQHPSPLLMGLGCVNTEPKA